MPDRRCTGCEMQQASVERTPGSHLDITALSSPQSQVLGVANERKIEEGRKWQDCNLDEAPKTGGQGRYYVYGKGKYSLTI